MSVIFSHVIYLCLTGVAVIVVMVLTAIIGEFVSEIRQIRRPQND